MEILDSIDSTSSELARRWQAGTAKPGDVLRARYQSAGRGRLGRSFIAEPDQALLISTIATLPTLSHLGWLSHATALAMSAAIGGVDLKWPNDLQIDGVKLGGVLGEIIETDPLVVVLGCGINTVSAPAGATCLAEHGHDVSPEAVDRIAATFITELRDRLDLIATANTDELHRELTGRCVTLSHPVTATVAGGRVITGTATGISPTGALIIDDTFELSEADIKGDQ